MEKDNWKEIFKHKILGPIVIGCIVIVVGKLTPYETEFLWAGIGMGIIGHYFWFNS